MEHSWIPVALLPNIRLQQPAGNEVIALASQMDQRVRTITGELPRFAELLSRFTDQLGVNVEPTVLIVRADSQEAREAEALAGFLDACALSVIPYRRAHRLVEKADVPGAVYSDSFELYPWMLDEAGKWIVRNTPAVWSADEMQKFQGQSNPGLTPDDAEIEDHQLFNVLLKRWTERFLQANPSWENLALFRSLNMAQNASRMPTPIATIHDIGRPLALWVAAFEILVHPGGQGRASRDKVIQQIRNVPDRNPKVIKQAIELCRQLYKLRNDFLHGNLVDVDKLDFEGSRASVFWLAPCLYRLALAGFLGLSPESLQVDDFALFKRQRRPTEVEAALCPLP